MTGRGPYEKEFKESGWSRPASASERIDSLPRGHQRMGRPTLRESRRDPDVMAVDMVSTRGDSDRGWQKRADGLTEDDWKKHRTKG